jgi:hypothetical protein
MPESAGFTIKTRRIQRDREHWLGLPIAQRRGQWQKEARVNREPWQYLLAAQQIVGSSNWIVRVQDTQTGEVLDERSAGPGHNLAVQKELVRRLHEKATTP